MRAGKRTFNLQAIESQIEGIGSLRGRQLVNELNSKK